MYLWVVAVSDAILFNDYNDKLIFKFLLLANLSFFVFYKIIIMFMTSLDIYFYHAVCYLTFALSLLLFEFFQNIFQ